MVNRSRVAWCAKSAARTALIVFLSVLIISPVRPVIDFLFGKRFRFHWAGAVEFDLVFSFAWFCLLFVWSLISAIRQQPALDVLESESLESDLHRLALKGFVAMEYFWGILNRTFLVFIAPEGLYGWRVAGPVTNANRTYYEPWEEMLKDDEFMRGREAIRRLSRLRGGFFLERGVIDRVEADDRQKWGMGGILHSGRIHVFLKTGRSREFILLGVQYPEEARDRISTTLAGSVTSAV